MERAASVLPAAAHIFTKQPPSEKCRLPGFVLSHRTWANGVLTPVYHQPLMLAVKVAACAEEKAAEVARHDLLSKRLPFRSLLCGPIWQGPDAVCGVCHACLSGNRLANKNSLDVQWMSRLG
jgi:hypothetical protein